jgi:tetratricopeptide (TPR) repeat protein
VGVSLNNLAIVDMRRGDYASARARHEEALAIFHALGDRQGIASSLSNLALVTYHQGDYAAARALYEESLGSYAAVTDRWGIAWSLESLATVELATQAPERAARLWGGAQRLREEMGSPVSPTDRPRYDSQIAAARAAMGDDAAFDIAMQKGHAMTPEEAVAYALNRDSSPRCDDPCALSA